MTFLYTGRCNISDTSNDRVQEVIEGLAVTDELTERLRWAAFDRLRAHTPATPSALADDLATSVEAVEEVLAAQLAAGRFERDHAGVVVGAHGLTLLPTRHTLTMSGRDLHTWCALDAIGIPAAAGDDALVATSCGWCDQPITVSVSAGRPLDRGHQVLWLPTAPCPNVREQFCPHANLFCRRRHLKRWRKAAGRPEGHVLTLDAVAELGRQTWRRP